MKHALFDENGLPLGFYADDIHGPRMRPVYGDDDPTEIVGEGPNPDTLIPSDAIEITDEQWQEFLSNQGRRKWQDGEVVEYDPPPAPLTADDFQRAIQAHVDAAAVSKLYNNGNALAGYVASTNPQWAAEAQAFVAWRDAVWLYAYAEMDKVMSGTREIPTIEGIITELPAVAWPE